MLAWLARENQNTLTSQPCLHTLMQTPLSANQSGIKAAQIVCNPTVCIRTWYREYRLVHAVSQSYNRSLAFSLHKRYFAIKHAWTKKYGTIWPAVGRQLWTIKLRAALLPTACESKPPCNSNLHIRSYFIRLLLCCMYTETIKRTTSELIILLYFLYTRKPCCTQNFKRSKFPFPTSSLSAWIHGRLF